MLSTQVHLTKMRRVYIWDMKDRRGNKMQVVIKDENVVHKKGKDRQNRIN